MPPLRGRDSEAWRLLLELLDADRARRPAIAAEQGLSEAQAEVLALVDPTEPMPMCRIAERLGCDRSNVTGIVDRLEARGLVERRPDPGDRRVRTLVLTPAGRAVRDRLIERLGEPPRALRALPAADRDRLCAILRRVVRVSR